MADEDVEVRFGAQTGAVVEAIDKVKEAIEGFTAPIEAVSQSFSALKETIIGAIGVEAIKKVTEFVEGFAQIGEQVERQSAMLGASAKDVQELGFVAKMSGGSAESLASSMMRLQVNLQAAQNPTSRQALALKELKVSAEQLLSVPLSERLDLLADGFKRLKDQGTDPASLAMILMGRGAAGMVPQLERGREGIEELKKQAEETGAVLSKDTVESLVKLEHSSVGLEAAIKGLAGTFAGSLAPSLTESNKHLADLIGTISVAVQTHTLYDRVVVLTHAAIDELGQAFKNFGVTLKDVFSFSWSKIAADQEAGMAKIMAIDTAAMKKLDDMAKAATAEFVKTLSDPGEKTLKAPNLDLSGIRALEEEYKSLGKAAKEAYATTNKLAEDAFGRTKEHLSAELAQHTITYSQENTALLAALDARLKAQRDALAKEYGAEESAMLGRLALFPRESAQWKAAKDEEKATYQKYLDDLAKLDSKYQTEHQKMVDDLATHDVQAWKTVADQFATAFGSQLQKVLSHAESWGTAMKAISGQLVIKLIEDQAKVTLQYVLGEAAKTAATLAGTSAREAADLLAGKTSIVEATVNALKSIFAGAAQTSAEVSAVVAPVAGPAAPAIGEAAGAAVISIGEGLIASAAIGGYVVKPGLLSVHSGETISPARVDQPFRGGGGGDTHLHFSPNLSAFNPAGLQQVIKQMMPQLLREMSAAMKLAPSAQ